MNKPGTSCKDESVNYCAFYAYFFLFFKEIEETREFLDNGSTMIMTMRIPGKDESTARRIFKRIST
jgi:hypothetical protein